ncbi:MAG TPA: DUF192 domain-containing protein [Dehalococcoidia bacterium]|nr:DUF192 domain-containing protein [Dehalococcoidia bacterium]
MRRPLAAGLAIGAAALLAVACGGGASRAVTPSPAAPPAATVAPVSFPRTQLSIIGAGGARLIDVEVATTPAQSERGLGYRDALAPDAGMLFDLGHARTQQFWMKGMRFALDLVWIGEDKRVAGVTPDVPPQPGAADADLLLYAPPVPVSYVLEINAGAAARLGIATGTPLAFTIPAE